MPSENTLYPIFLDLTERQTVVIGGGEVAWRKVQSLLDAGAKVRVVTPWALPEVERMAAEGLIELVMRGYEPGDLAGARIVIAATNVREVNAAVSAEGRERGIPVNVVDDLTYCDFHVPAIVNQGPIKIAISTGGGSPLLATRIKQQVADHVGSEWADRARFVAAVRGLVQARWPEDSRTRRRYYEQALDHPLENPLSPEGLARALKEMGL